MARIIVEPAASGNDQSDSLAKALRSLGESGIKTQSDHAGLKIRGHSRARPFEGRCVRVIFAPLSSDNRLSYQAPISSPSDRN